MTAKELIIQSVDSRADEYIAASGRIHDYAELSYEEFQSMGELTALLNKEGFTVETGLVDMPTCFTGKWGSGSPVIGFLGEFDALAGLSQESGNPKHTPLKEGAPGHGCGHSLLGVGALAAAVALRDYLQAETKSGTIIYYGCPAEEGAGSKQFMARAGLFDCCDFIYTWHPATTNDVANTASNAIMGANFEFFGLAAHAGGSPWLGRSALDACELMNVGCNYLREHIRDGERVHYAYGDPGGSYPNVVQDYARLKYEVRAPKVSQMKELFARVVKIAEGAALMTETTMKYEITMAFSDELNNSVLAGYLTEALRDIGIPEWDESDYALAKAYFDSYDKKTRTNIIAGLKERFGSAAVNAPGGILDRPLHSDIIPYDKEKYTQQAGSTDVGDVTYCVPTAELHVATACMGNIGHTWQMAGQAGSTIGMKGMLVAAKVMALAASRLMDAPDDIAAAKAETDERSGGKYECPLPDYVKPPVGKY